MGDPFYILSHRQGRHGPGVVWKWMRRSGLQFVKDFVTDHVLVPAKLGVPESQFLDADRGQKPGSFRVMATILRSFIACITTSNLRHFHLRKTYQDCLVERIHVEHLEHPEIVVAIQPQGMRGLGEPRPLEGFHGLSTLNTKTNNLLSGRHPYRPIPAAHDVSDHIHRFAGQDTSIFKGAKQLARPVFREPAPDPVFMILEQHNSRVGCNRVSV